ncbi:prenyltransferase [Simiduia aestuariiviva]|uniref:Prenyltransferase n=1 Tax=Simiduia aestuariiviva TaxID=1510459 RepID=A0A839UGF1_9GAMM|nr:hypothetical protein [Simiduia aestuariiviva]
MTSLLLQKGRFPKALLAPTVNYILAQQFEDGCIPWYRGDKADPWDHTEAAMGLSIAGEWAAAELAYQWLADQQLADGSWWNHYRNNQALCKKKRETNFIAYVATGIWHHYLITEDRSFLQHHWQMVRQAINFVLRFQSVHGEIDWAVDEQDCGLGDALITANSSIAKSLECAINIAVVLAEDCQHWRTARTRLVDCLRHKPERFDRTWESKARYSMDWFYPVLTGVITGDDARKRIDSRWSTFVENNLGCRCVSDEPWVTIAESCELTMALLAIGDHARAVNLYSWLHQFLDSDGGYWMGYQFRDKVVWPEEKTTWTSGAILLAADALTEHTPAARLFTQVNLLAPAQQRKSRTLTV